MTAEIRPAHSPLGASGAERWMNCPGSVALLKELKLPENDDPTYRREGTSAHAANHKCLVEGLDAWEVIGETFERTEVDADMAEAMQVFLDHVRSLITPTAKTYYEFGIDAPDFHPDFYGTLDCGIVDGKVMFIRDYKHGQGIAVDVEWNPQVMYYAYGLLRHHPDVETIDVGIVQPRGFHPDGSVRTWTIPAEHLRAWAEKELKGAMDAVAMDHSLDAGPWCRFCPAKLVCPMLTGLFQAAATADPRLVINLSDEALGRDYKYREAVKFYLKAQDDEAFRRLNQGLDLPGVKLVQKKANRILKTGAELVFQNAFGDKAYTAPVLKSPPELEKLGPSAKSLVREWAYTPQSGLTVALDTDKRPGVKVQSTTEVFASALTTLEPQET